MSSAASELSANFHPVVDAMLVLLRLARGDSCGGMIERAMSPDELVPIKIAVALLPKARRGIGEVELGFDPADIEVEAMRQGVVLTAPLRGDIRAIEAVLLAGGLNL